MQLTWESLTALEGVVRYRLQQDCGDGWRWSSHLNRLLTEAVHYGIGEALLERHEQDAFKKAARRATDRAKRWLSHEASREKHERLGFDGALRLAGAVYGKGVYGDDEPGLLSSAADVPVLARLELAHVARLVEALDKHHRQVVEARYWREEPWADIARSLGKTERTARRWHDEALNELRYWLAPAPAVAA